MNNNSATFLNDLKSNHSIDLRAELLVNHLISKGFDPEKIRLIYEGLFYRNFNRDIISFKEDIDDDSLINIHISRDSIYHVLPEGITHDYRSADSKSDPVQEYKKRKKEEKQAREFFRPIENEFFQFRLQTEAHEENFFEQINTHGIADIIKSILGIRVQIPDNLLVKLFALLMQEKSFVSRDIKNVRRALQAILKEKVSVTTKNIQLEDNEIKANDDSDLQLGINTALQSDKKIFLKKYHFIIGPLHSSSSLVDYIYNGKMKNFLEVFFNLFLPFQTQSSFQINLRTEDELFLINDSEYKSRLGISTVL